MTSHYPHGRPTPQQTSVSGTRSSLPCLLEKNKNSALHPMVSIPTVLTHSAPYSDFYWLPSTNPIKNCALSNYKIACSLKYSSTHAALFLSPQYRPQAHSIHGSTKAAPLLAQTKCPSLNFNPIATSYSPGSASQEIWITSQSTSNKNLLELDERRYLYLSGRPNRHNCKS